MPKSDQKFIYADFLNELSTYGSMMQNTPMRFSTDVWQLLVDVSISPGLVPII